MSLLPSGCTLTQLHQALPFPLGVRDLTGEMRDLRSRQFVQLKPDRHVQKGGSARGRSMDATLADMMDMDEDEDEDLEIGGGGFTAGPALGLTPSAQAALAK